MVVVIPGQMSMRQDFGLEGSRMTNRQRILKILDGELPDQIPWIPRLSIWYDANRAAGTLPERYRGLSLREIERKVFGGTAARDGAVFRSVLEQVEVRSHRVGDGETVTQYITPVGQVTTRQRAMACAGLRDAETQFMLKRREDYAVVQYMIEHTRYEPTYQQYADYEQEIGEEGYPIVNCGDCPFHSMSICGKCSARSVRAGRLFSASRTTSCRRPRSNGSRGSRVW